MKTCTQCSFEKPLTAFANSPMHKMGVHSVCKECKKGYALKGSYGLTSDDIAEIRQFQGNECAVCRETLKKTHVDHCHATNEVRGLLCPPCNMALGLFQDNPERLREAARYVETFQQPLLEVV